MRQRDNLGPTSWNCHLHPSLCFSGSSNHLIHAFLAVASLGNLCPPKLLHLGTQHSVPRLFLLRLSMPPTATHQQDNSYGGSAIWQVSKFLIPLIDGSYKYWMNLPWGTGALPKGFTVGSPALCTYYGESQSVVGKHNLEIMKDIVHCNHAN